MTELQQLTVRNVSLTVSGTVQLLKKTSEELYKEIESHMQSNG